MLEHHRDLDSHAEALPAIMTADQAAEFLGCSAWSVREYSRQGRIPHRRIGRKYIFSKDALLRWLRGELEPELKLIDHDRRLRAVR
ncbi:MAG: helix-turn-helix domain-containing protein [Candidatus Desulforudaceae bacterium]